MRRAGYVLAGGRSTRMGRDKAMLPYGETTMLEHMVRVVGLCTEKVKVVAPGGRYVETGLEVVADRVEDCGPLGGIEAALADSEAEWTLITACDLPHVTVELLERLLRVAERGEADVVMPVAGSDEQPLCAVYGRGALGAVQAALREGRYRVKGAFCGLRVWREMIEDTVVLTNTNTPGEWAAAMKGRG